MVKMNQRNPRVGAYGGTFDPIHLGHLEVARTVVSNFDLERLLIIPAYRPPHKDPRSLSDSYHRYAMAVLSTLDEPRITVSTIEIDTPDRCYTFQTIARMRENYGPAARLFFVLGADSFNEIDTWREPRTLLASTNLIVVARPGFKVNWNHLPDEFASRVVDLRADEGDMARVRTDGVVDSVIYVTSYVQNDISSTEIRRRVRERETIEGLVSPPVITYINRYELYRQ
jgi:nicotinate-nucleotide adenylyltransferase